MPIPIWWENGVYPDKDIMIKGQEEILKEEITTKTEEVGMTPEEDPSIEDIIEEIMTDKEAFQETWGQCQEIEVNHQMVEIEVRQKEEEQMRKEADQYNIINV